MDLLLSLKFGLGSIGSAVSSWLLNLDSTNWAELSEPKELNVGDKVSVEFSTTSSGRLNALLGSDVLPEMYVQFSSIDQAFLQGCTLSIDGTAIAHGDSIAAYLDGQKHTAIATLTDTRNISLVGQNGAGNAGFIGVIYSPALEDIDTPANSISWNLDSGPPVYDVGAELVVNGDFDTDTEWTLSSQCSILDGELHLISSDGSYQSASQTIKGSIVGDFYVTTIVQTRVGVGQAKVSWVGDSSPTANAVFPRTVGTHSIVWQNNGNGSRSIDLGRVGGATDIDISSLSIKPYINTISDGTIYQESEEHGTEADIMRADDWATPPFGVTVSGKSVTFEGTNGSWTTAIPNSGQLYSGLHVLTYKVFNYVSGYVKVSMRGSPTTTQHKSNGVYTVYQNPTDKEITVGALGFSELSVEIISIKPVPQGLIYKNVTVSDWLPTPIN